MKEKAFLYGPFVGELYWEAGRFAPICIHQTKNQKPKNKNTKVIVFTREERFDLYGKYADILVPMRIDGDYINLQPNCFKLNGASNELYANLIANFKNKYEKRFEISLHLFPNIEGRHYENKTQFRKYKLDYSYAPRDANYNLVNEYLLKNNKPLVVLGSRYRQGFRRNWGNWQRFYDLLYKDKYLMENFSFVICGKVGEYIADKDHRFYDMNDIGLIEGTSLIGLLLVILEKAFFTFGSQSAIPNLSLLYGVEVLEFGCQKSYHTKTYNVKNTPIKFIENKSYNLDAGVAINELKGLLKNKLKRRK